MSSIPVLAFVYRQLYDKSILRDKQAFVSPGTSVCVIK